MSDEREYVNPFAGKSAAKGVSDEYFAAHGDPAAVEAASGAPESTKTTEEGTTGHDEGLEAKLKAELVKEAEKEGVSTSGTKAEIIDRIEQARSYEDMKKDELIKLAESRDLPSSGTKAEIIEGLKAADIQIAGGE